MEKINYLTLSGVAMGAAGIMMLISESIGIGVAKTLVPLLFATAGILAYLFSEANKHHKIARLYHLLQGGGMVLFAFLIGVIPQSLGEFLKFVTYFVLMFGLIEILFGFMALNSGIKLNMGILISRFIAGFLSLIGAVLLLATAASDEVSGLMIAGILTIIGGVGFTMFSFRIRKMKVKS